MVFITFILLYLPFSLSILMVPLSSIISVKHGCNSAFYNYHFFDFPSVITWMIISSFNQTAVLYVHLLIGHFHFCVLSILVKKSNIKIKDIFLTKPASLLFPTSGHYSFPMQSCLTF